MQEQQLPFGQYIRNLRISHNLRQNDVSDMAEIKKTYLSKIENDRVDPPSEEILIRLAKVLHENPLKMIIRAGKVPSVFQSIIVNDEETFQYLEKKYYAENDQSLVNRKLGESK